MESSLSLSDDGRFPSTSADLAFLQTGRLLRILDEKQKKELLDGLWQKIEAPVRTSHEKADSKHLESVSAFIKGIHASSKLMSPGAESISKKKRGLRFEGGGEVDEKAKIDTSFSSIDVRLIELSAALCSESLKALKAEKSLADAAFLCEVASTLKVTRFYERMVGEMGFKEASKDRSAAAIVLDECVMSLARSEEYEAMRPEVARLGVLVAGAMGKEEKRRFMEEIVLLEDDGWLEAFLKRLCEGRDEGVAEMLASEVMGKRMVGVAEKLAGDMKENEDGWRLLKTAFENGEYL